MTQRVYVDTSVIGGCFDEEFKEDSLSFIKEVHSGRKILLISDILLLELEEAPEQVRNIIENISEDNKEYIPLSEVAIELAQIYIQEGSVAEGSLSDARHIAIASVEKADVLVSWNFKHIVNLNRIHMFNSVNLKEGYHTLEIRSPKEVLDG